MLRIALFLARTPKSIAIPIYAFALFAVASSARAQTAVPYTIIHIHGTVLADDTVNAAYRAYQNPGDHYRVLCPEPCTADQNAIYGLYAGFGQAYQQVVALFGVEPLASMQPFDLHVTDDHWCGTSDNAPAAGDSGEYASYTGLTSGTYGCFWFDDPAKTLPFQYPDTESLSYQLLTTHEFTHTVFFQRHDKSYEDAAKAVSYYVAGITPDPPITDPCNDHLDSVYQGKLFWVLCQVNGFQFADLAPAFVALDTAYQNGNVEANGRTGIFQFRKKLNAVLGSDTTDAFLAMKQVNQNVVGGRGWMRQAGSRTSPIAGWTSLFLAPNAVSSDTRLVVEGLYGFPTPALPPGSWEWANTYRLSRPDGSDVTFASPGYFQIKYDPYNLTYGTDESTLQLYHLVGTTWTAVPSSRLDADKMTLGAPITETGFYAVAASTTTTPATSVIPRVVSNANIRTDVVLVNPGFATSQSGTVVFHPQGVAASASDPFVSYSLAGHKTLVLTDIVASIGGSGAGTVDIVSTSGPVPDVSVHFVELGTSGYPGTFGAAYPIAAALHVGDRGVLMAPANMAQESFRFVVRTLASGATFTVTTRDASGVVIATTPLTYAANTQFEVLPKDFNGGATVAGNTSFDIQMQSGSAFILTETIESGMTTRNSQPAIRYEPAASGTGDTAHIAKAVHATNPDGSTARTALQLFNPGTSTVTGKVAFSPAGATTSVGFSYSLAPGVTKVYADPVNALGASGDGALDIRSTSGPLPVAFARIVHAGGTTPFQAARVPATDVLDLLRAGDRVTLVAPEASALPNYSIGIRTFKNDLILSLVVYFYEGSYEATLTKTIPADTWIETDISSWLGIAPYGGDILAISVDSGRGLIYGTTTNPTNGAVNYQPTKRLPFNY